MEYGIIMVYGPMWSPVQTAQGLLAASRTLSDADADDGGAAGVARPAPERCGIPVMRAPKEYINIRILIWYSSIIWYIIV